jgi:hypothetical protein
VHKYACLVSTECNFRLLRTSKSVNWNKFYGIFFVPLFQETTKCALWKKGTYFCCCTNATEYVRFHFFKKLLVK